MDYIIVKFGHITKSRKVSENNNEWCEEAARLQVA